MYLLALLSAYFLYVILICLRYNSARRLDMGISIDKWLLVLIFILVIVGILQFIFLFRLTLLLRNIVMQLQESRSESRILSRNLMSTIQESSRSLVIELRDEFDKAARKVGEYDK
jgi:hypothetical protein